MKIDIILDGEVYVSSSWDSAPREGDYVSVKGKKAGTYRVVDVVWRCSDVPQVLVTLKT